MLVGGNSAPRSHLQGASWGVGYEERRALGMRESWVLDLRGKVLEEVRGVLRKEEEKTGRLQSGSRRQLQMAVD